MGQNNYISFGGFILPLNKVYYCDEVPGSPPCGTSHIGNPTPNSPTELLALVTQQSLEVLQQYFANGTDVYITQQSLEVLQIYGYGPPPPPSNHQLGIVVGYQGTGSPTQIITDTTGFAPPNPWVVISPSGADVGSMVLLDVIWNSDASLIFAVGDGVVLSTDKGSTFNEVLAPGLPGGIVLANGSLGGHAGVITDTGRIAVTAIDGSNNAYIYYADSPYTAWTQVPITYPSSRTGTGNGIGGMAYISGVGLAAVGESQDIPGDFIWTDIYFSSDNGASWSNSLSINRGSTGSSTTATPLCIESNGSYFLIISGPIFYPNNIYTTISSNGTSWTDHLTTMVRFGDQFWRTKFWDSTRNQWVLITNNNTSIGGAVYISSDGITWNSAYTGTDVDDTWQGILQLGTDYLICGQNTGGSTSIFARSTDGGSTWTQSTVGTNLGPLIMFGNKDTGLLAILDTDFSGTYWTSIDNGATWTENDSYFTGTIVGFQDSWQIPLP